MLEGRRISELSLVALAIVLAISLGLWAMNFAEAETRADHAFQ